MLLSNLEEGLFFITRRRMYRNHVTYLLQEYRKMTGGALTNTDRISNAPVLVGKRASSVLIGFLGCSEPGIRVCQTGETGWHIS